MLFAANLKHAPVFMLFRQGSETMHDLIQHMKHDVQQIRHNQKFLFFSEKEILRKNHQTSLLFQRSKKSLLMMLRLAHHPAPRLHLDKNMRRCIQITKIILPSCNPDPHNSRRRSYRNRPVGQTGYYVCFPDNFSLLQGKRIRLFILRHRAGAISR